MQMLPRVTNITCITQVTFKLINKRYLVDNRRLDFRRFQMLFDLVADKRGLEGHFLHDKKSDVCINTTSPAASQPFIG